MEKRTFIKLSSVLITGTAFSPMIEFIQDQQLRNWAGNYTYSTKELHTPDSVEAVQELVKRYQQLKVLGSRHSFNSIADTDTRFISLQALDKVIALDAQARRVTAGAGIKYGQLCPYLHQQGFALHNLASLPHISIAGACATATHGSGYHNGNLATAVAALEMVTADGSIVTLSREKDPGQFPGLVVNLGGAGVITKVTLDIQPAFNMRQDLYEWLPLEQLASHFEEVFSAAYSVSLFTDWKGPRFNQVWLKNLIRDGKPVTLPATFFGARPAARPLHPIVELSAENCTEQMGVPGPWHERLPHFRMNFTPSSGEELQSEYFVPLNKGYAALQAIDGMRDKIAPHLQISEIRTIAADQLWMSPCYQQPCMAIHFTWKKDWPNVQKVLPQIEARLAPLNARPHWGKLFTMAPARLAELYPRLPDFRRLLQQYDPAGKFRNPFLNRYIFGA